MSLLSERCLFSMISFGYNLLVSWKLLWDYFDFPIKYYNINFSNITYFVDGIMALKSNFTVIGAKQHWYSVEQILIIQTFNKKILEKGLINIIKKNIAFNIREINKRIIDVYLIPSTKYNKIIENDFKMRFNLSMNKEYLSIHLRVGDVDNQPFKKYINKTEIKSLIQTIRNYKNIKIIVVSDSISIKRQIKMELGDCIYTDYKKPCHSRYINCLNRSMNDIMMLKNSVYLILTRGSTFSLFISYFSKCKYNKIMYIGHDYEHKNYY